MNFFEHQQRARERTWLLTLLFIGAVLATVFLANLIVLVAVAIHTSDFGVTLSPATWVRDHPQAVFWASFGTLSVIGGASMFRMATLSAGGGAVARALGGVRVEAGTDDPQKRQLLNVVEEMAIAGGIPVPEVYVLEQEPGINAFAAGFTTSDAAVAVTRGTLELLTRDELQGVIAHEFSHIFNGDMRLNTRLLGVLHGILFIGLTGRVIVRGLSRVRATSRGRGGHWVAVVFVAGLALIVVGYIGSLFGSMIRAAVSRQREFLADASAVQFTRNPHGIAGALKKIAVSPLRAVLQTVDGAEMSHMLIADGRGMFEAVFATHPPVLERIRAIDKSFDKSFDPSELARIKLPAAAAAVKPSSSPISPALVVASIGNPAQGQLHRSAASEAAIPDALRRAARSRLHAPSLVLALALSKDPGERTRQIARLSQRLPSTLLPHLHAVTALVEPLPPDQRLPLIELAFPALRQRAPAELQALVAAIDEIARMDGRFDFLDYALVRLLRLQLAEAAAPQTVHGGLPPKLHAVRAHLAVLFTVLAQAGDRDKFGAHRAYDAGMRQLLSGEAPAYAPIEPWVAPLDRALARLDALAPLSKQALIEALVVTVAHDRRVNLGELELLRAVCASLHCPLPPLALPDTTRAGVSGRPHAAA